MKKLLHLACSAVLAAGIPLTAATTWHVSTDGNDSAAGTPEAPLRTIQAAAVKAMPGDTVLVRSGTYREWVNPPRGGVSERERITYAAAPGEKVIIKGSEVVAGWEHTGGDVWKAVVPNERFGAFNPFADSIHGDWFNPKGRPHHTAAVYVDGEWLPEAATGDGLSADTGGKPCWHARVENERTVIHARFPGLDPSRHLVEINMRRAVFYPDAPGRNFITVRGFTLCHAAAPWAPPTAEQVALLGTHWSKGWIIEDNEISHSMCAGVSLGKHGDEFDNKSANSAEGYVKTIERALAHPIPWKRGHVGGHLVRNNRISHCEQAGIVGSMGGAFSTITGNHIHGIHVRRAFTGAEMAGIKLHGAIDCLIAGNHIHHAYRGIWLDWMAQNARVSCNLMHDNSEQDVYLEVNHGPHLLDHNILMSPVNLWDMSEGGAFVHNLFAGKIVAQPERSRKTPFHPPHDTAISGLSHIEGGDNRYHNNIFVGDGTDGAESKPAAPQHSPRGAGYGLWVYDKSSLPIAASGNVYLHGARPHAGEKAAGVSNHNPRVGLENEGGRLFLKMDPGGSLGDTSTVLVTTGLLGRASVSGIPFTAPDGAPLSIDRDFAGASRDTTRPVSGPFESRAGGRFDLGESPGSTRKFGLEKQAASAPGQGDAAPIDAATMKRVYETVKTPFKYGIVLRGSADEKIDCPNVFRHGDAWFMMYIAFDGRGYETRLARSTNLLDWKPLGAILTRNSGAWDNEQAAAGVALIQTDWDGDWTLGRHNGRYWLSYLGGTKPGYETPPLSVGLAWTDDPSRPKEWARLAENPVLTPSQPDARMFEKDTLFKSNIIADPEKRTGYPFVMFYNARQQGAGVERIGIAGSHDLVDWKRVGGSHVLSHGDQRGISGDPQLVRMDDLWVMFYFGAFWRPGAFDTFAVSRDLVHWTKWDGPDLIAPSEPWDREYAHKPWVIKHEGVVYHFYCAVGNEGRCIAVATSKDLRSNR